MIGSQNSVDAPRRASREVRQELLDHLGVPLGTATVARRRTRDGDTLVVRLIAPSLLPANRRITRFKDFPVEFEIVKPLKLGHP
jgi:hypothetical protein